MKKTIAEVRKMIKEELVNGVPEHQFRSAAHEYVDSVRQLLRRHIMLDKSKNATERQQAFNVANTILKELEKETFDLLEEKLHKFTQNT